MDGLGRNVNERRGYGCNAEDENDLPETEHLKERHTNYIQLSYIA